MASATDIALVTVVVLAMFFDLKQRRIPNWLTASGAVIGLTLNSLGGFSQFLYGFLGLAAGIAILILPFALGWVGAGDVKLVGALGALLGVHWLPRILFYTGLISGLLALFSVAIRGVERKGFTRLWTDVKLFVMSLGRVLPEPISQRASEKKTIPWAVGIGLGVLVAFYLDRDGRWAGF